MAGSDHRFDVVTPVSVESKDTLDKAQDSALISYQLGISSPWEDGLDFSDFADISVCLGVGNTSGTAVLVAPERRLASTPLDMETPHACGISTNSPACGCL